MTTRTALLRALSLLLLGSMLVMTGLSFFNFRRAMRVEIAANLEFSASVVKERIDTLLYTQVENLRVWRSLQVMQDIAVGDIDKRLSGTLAEFRAGHASLYRALLCTDNAGRVVASSDVSKIGGSISASGDWLRLPAPASADIFVSPIGGHDRLDMTLRTDIPSTFGAGSLGNLYVLLDFTAFETVLDEAVAGSPRNLLIVDAADRVIAASRELRQRLDISALRLDHWSTPKPGVASHVRDGAALGDSTLLVGAALSSRHPELAGLDWRILIVESTAVAFSPVLHLLWSQLALLVFTMSIGVAIASRLASRIAQPIVELTAFIRRVRQGDTALPKSPSPAISEAAELFDAFVDMIRALERSREQIVRTGKLAVVGEMAAIMAHEIRTPMSIVRSSAQLLDRQPGLREKERELIAFMLEETERLNRLVTMLLECARPKLPDLQPHDLHAIVHNVLDLIAARVEAARVTVELTSGSAEMVFECDKEQMMQVFLNLVLNALPFMPDGGTLGIATTLDADTLLISVGDSGSGVPADIRGRIFDPFFSRREGGIGLGLTIVQQIVQAHGGEIAVGESPWGGASFDMRFPLNAAASRS